MNQDIKEVVCQFNPISLLEMDGVALMDRADTKFLLPKNKVADLLTNVLNDYKVLEVKNDRVMTYNSLYYDTPENDFYKWHHNGKVNRLKIRIRNYVESNIHFLEVKRKDGKGKTKKRRIGVLGFENKLNENSNEFIQNTTKSTFKLSPTLENSFNRITLVSQVLKERVTIDFNLGFRNNTKSKNFERLAIIEIKQERVNRSSPVFLALRKQQIQPNSISKYCLGMISLYENIKYNSFKQKLLKIEKITA
jgi:hypothetical protein